VVEPVRYYTDTGLEALRKATWSLRQNNCPVRL